MNKNTIYEPLPIAILYDYKLSAVDVRVYVHICWTSGINGKKTGEYKMWESQETSAKKLGLSMSTYQRSIRKLRQQGLISVVQRQRETSVVYPREQAS